MKLSKKYSKRQTYKLKKINRLILIAMLFSGVAYAKQTPFPSTPYYMKSTKIDRAKPNLVFLLDNSASMNTRDVIDPDTGLREHRYLVARKVAKKAVLEFKDDFRWGLAFLNQAPSSFNLKTGTFPDDLEIKGAGVYQIYNRLGNLTSSPATSGQMGLIHTPLQDSSPEHIENLLEEIEKLNAIGGTPLNTALRTVYNYMSGNSFQDLVSTTYTHPNNNIYNYDFATSDASKDIIQYRCQRNYVLVLGDGEGSIGALTYVNKDEPRKLEYPWAYAFNSDYRSHNFAPMKQDKEQQSWDDPFFPRQNIITHTIGLRAGSGSLKRIANEAGGRFIMTNTGDELESALKQVLSTMSIDVPDYIRFDRITYTNPNALLEPDNNLLSLINLDSEAWSSTVMFKEPNPDSPSGFTQKNNEDIIVYPISSHESQRNLAVTLPNRDNKGKVTSGSKVYNLSRNNLGHAENRVLNNNYFSLNEIYANDYPEEFVEVIESKPGEEDHVDVVLKDPKNALHTLRWKDGYIPWLTGWEDRDDESNIKTGSLPDYRERSKARSSAANEAMRRHLGDIVNANIIYLGEPIKKRLALFGKDYMLPNYMVPQSNDGMVRIYTSEGGYANRPYLERFAYVPGNALRENNRRFIEDLSIRAQKNYGTGTEREDFMSGPVNSYSTPSLTGKSPQRYFFIGLLGQGGRAAYALNVGGKDDVLTKVGSREDYKAVGTTRVGHQITAREDILLWDTSTDAFGDTGEIKDMGYTLSNAIVGMVALSRGTNKQPQYTGNASGTLYATFLPNGYDYDTKINKKPAIYMIDTLGTQYNYSSAYNVKNTSYRNNKPGKIIKKIVIDSANDGAVLSGISAVDYNFDGITDALYVGDSFGDVHRVDLRVNGSITNDNLKFKSYKIFKGHPKQHITAAPSIYHNGDGNVQVLFGTGRNYLEEDIITNDTNLQSLTNQSFYSITDNIHQSPTQPIASYNTRDKNLLKQTLSEATAINQHGVQEAVRVISSNDIERHHQGWYMDLSIAGQNKNGERVVTKPLVIDKTVFISTETVSFRLPENADELICIGASAETASMQYQLDVPTGKAMSYSKKGGIDSFVRNLNGNIQYVAGYRSPSSTITLINTDANNGKLARNGFGESLLHGRLSLPSNTSYYENCNDGIFIATEPNKKPVNFECRVPDSFKIKRLSWGEALD